MHPTRPALGQATLIQSCSKHCYATGTAHTLTQLTLFMMSDTANIYQLATGLTRPPWHNTYKSCAIDTTALGSLAAASSPEFQTCPSSSGCQCVPSLQDKKGGVRADQAHGLAVTRHAIGVIHPVGPTAQRHTDATCIRHTLQLTQAADTTWYRAHLRTLHTILI